MTWEELLGQLSNCNDKQLQQDVEVELSLEGQPYVINPIQLSVAEAGELTLKCREYTASGRRLK